MKMWQKSNARNVVQSVEQQKLDWWSIKNYTKKSVDPTMTFYWNPNRNTWRRKLNSSTIKGSSNSYIDFPPLQHPKSCRCMTQTRNWLMTLECSSTVKSRTLWTNLVVASPCLRKLQQVSGRRPGSQNFNQCMRTTWGKSSSKVRPSPVA